MTLVNQPLVDELMARIQMAADACGLVLRPPAPRWNPAEVSVALDFRLPPSGQGVQATPTVAPAWQGAAQDAWNRNCFRYGLEPSDYQRTITMPSGNSYQLVAIHTNRPKYAIDGLHTVSHRIYKIRATEAARLCRLARQAQQPQPISL